MTAVVLVILLMGLGWARGQLSVDYYQSTCPQLESIIRDQMIRKQAAHPTTAAGTLRILFHDCFVEGCDASVLIASTANNTAEKDADINMSLPGDGFDAVIRAKTAVEAQCPGVVSYADILSIVTRDLITLVGGPYYEVTKGRRDGLISPASSVKGNLPESNMTLDELNALFESKGFTDAEMVTLSAAHTVGFSHCKEFLNRIMKHMFDFLSIFQIKIRACRLHPCFLILVELIIREKTIRFANMPQMQCIAKVLESTEWVGSSVFMAC